MRKLIAATLLGLAACATPQEQCIANIGKEMRVIQELIQTTRGNLARGFAFETQTVFVNTEQVCGQNAKGEDITCTIPVAEEQSAPVAIDLVAEQAKLNSLTARHRELVGARDGKVAAIGKR